MLTEFLEDRAALYASGGMAAHEREPFELVLEFHVELRAFVTGLVEVTALLTLASLPRETAAVSLGLKSRIARLLPSHPQHSTPDGMVMSGPDGLVQWVNPTFSAMCGYSFDELHGKNLGPLLQCAETNRETAERLRQAVHDHRPCRETILNYHKNGTPYWAEVSINPILDDAGQLLWMIACERELIDYAAA